MVFMVEVSSPIISLKANFFLGLIFKCSPTKFLPRENLNSVAICCGTSNTSSLN